MEEEREKRTRRVTGQSFDNRREDELKDKGAEFIQLNRSSPQNGTFLHVKYSVFKGAEKK